MRLSIVVFGPLNDEKLVVACGRMLGEFLDTFYQLWSLSSHGHFVCCGCQKGRLQNLAVGPSIKPTHRRPFHPSRYT